MAKVKQKIKPLWAAPPGTETRRLTPELRAAVIGGWTPIDTDPLDRFVPDFFKTDDYPIKPVFVIRKPTQMDLMRAKQPESGKRLEEARKSFWDREGLAKLEAKAAEEKVKAWEATPEYQRMLAAALADAMAASCQGFLVGWEDWNDAHGKPIPFVAGRDGGPSPETLRILERAWSVMLAIHLRCQSLTHLSGLELDSFASSPTSGMGS